MTKEYPKLDKKYHEHTFPWKDIVDRESKFPKITFKASPIKFYTPLSGCAVDGPFEIEIKVDEPLKPRELKVTVEGNESVFTNPPYVVRCDPGQYPRTPIRVDATAKGGLFGRTIGSNYTHYPSECGEFNKEKILLLFCGPLEPWLESAGQPYWTNEQFSVAYNFAVCAIEHVFHFGLVPRFVGRFNFTTALVDPSQMDQWEHEYKPNKLVDVLGREKSPLLKINYSQIPVKWVPPKYTPVGSQLPGYFKPTFPFFPNDLGDIYETAAVRLATDFAEFKVSPAFPQCRRFSRDVFDTLKSKGYNIACLDYYSLYHAFKPHTLRQMIKSYVENEGITGIVEYDFILDISDFEQTKCLWEEVKDAIDFVEGETGKRLTWTSVQTTNTEVLGEREEAAKASFNILENEIKAAGIPDDAPLAVTLGEHGVPPGFAEHDTPHSNTMPRVRENMLNYFTNNISRVRSGKTEFALSMNEFTNRPDDGHASTMERIYEFLEKGYKYIILDSYYFPFESNDLQRHLRHWAFDFEDWMNIPHEEVKSLQKVLPDYRSRGTIRGTNIFIPGSVLGRYEKEPENPLIKEAYNLYREAVTDQIAKKLDSL
jgi:hypothetical protein